ncbi:MAG: long-chain fatty acid--CoA ligase [Rhodospirillales bacterium]|jgi:long-chain acyl-CoA synthetase|nr:long-chain fatty acid--CoA ligase [Rhodospirillales bacterium]
MDQWNWPNLVAMFFETAARKADKPFLWARVGDTYQPLSWRATADRVSALAAGLRELGVQKGDRIIVISENRPEWLIADVAIMAIGAITVPAYVTNTETDHLHVAVNSGARGAIVSTRQLAERFLPAAHKSDDMQFVVAMEPPDIDQNLSVSLHAWDQVIAAAGAGQAEAEAESWGRDDTACIIYTSGTGGAPKGVMLHHGAILHNCRGAYDALLELGLGDEVFLSFLPLSHSYEHTAGQFFPVSIGAQIYYAEGIETLGKNMVEVRPTIMTAVPRLYETLHARLTRGVRAKGGLSEKLFEKTVALGQKRYEARERLGFGESVADAILDRLVRGKVRQRFGGRLKALVSGGAPLNPDIGIFFTALGLRILQGYGQTEAAPVISVNRPNRVKIHTVGPAVVDTEVRIADDGEILVRGELVMQGYWRNAEATGEVIRDGWLHTGDVGHVDEDGYIEITDRKKDIIVNSGGDNVSPQRVEGILTLAPEVAQAMVYGDSRPHLVALLVPDEEWLGAWADQHGKGPNLKALSEDREFHGALAAIVERVNGQLSAIEKVRHFLIARAPFTIDNEQLTPTLKVRRHKIVENYGEALDALFH